MKKFFLLSVVTLFNLTALAVSPKLETEKFFDDIDLYDSSLSITIVEKKDKLVKSLMFKNKPELLKKIQKAMMADKELASSKSLSTYNGEISESIVINNEDEEIKIGLMNSKSQEIYFFIKIVPNKASSKESRRSRSSKATKSTKTKRGSKVTRNKTSNKDSDTDSGSTAVFIE